MQGLAPKPPETVIDKGTARISSTLLNFRSMAGLAGADGRRIRTGCLLRGGHSAVLTTSQVTTLRLLGVAGVCDLRSAAEQGRDPSPMPAHGFALVSAPPTHDPTAAMAVVGDPKATPGDVQAAMLGIYAAMPETLAPAFRAVFDAALSCRGAILVQCALGKDRTGAAIALLLGAVGVPRATILADYATSNAAQRAMFDALAARNPGRAPPPDAMLAPLLAADPAYLRAFWDRLDTDHGGEGGYLAGTLGLGGDAIGALRARWLN